MIGYPLDSRVTYDPFGVPVYDRAVISTALRKLYKSLFSDGVLPNPSTNLQVVAAADKIKVMAGFALCDGCQKLQEEDIELQLPASDTINPRIDTVVMRLDNNEDVRSCELHIISGVAAPAPVRPDLTRSESMWEIGLADIKRVANSTNITNADITDTRYETDRCGIISSISRFDTTTLYQQVQDDLFQFQNVSQAEFDQWFATIRDTLSGDTAGNLLNLINGVIDKVGTLDQLNTTDKSNLVAALNEIKRLIPTKMSQLTNDSGFKTTDNNTWKANTATSEGYVEKGQNQLNKVWGTNGSGVPSWKNESSLDSAESIKANTVGGRSAGALAVKALFNEVNNSLSKVKTYVGSDGKLHFVDASGADAVLNFSSGKEILFCVGLSITDALFLLKADGTVLTNKGNSEGEFNGNYIRAKMNVLAGSTYYPVITALKNARYKIHKFPTVSSSYVEETIDATAGQVITNVQQSGIWIVYVDE